MNMQLNVVHCLRNIDTQGDHCIRAELLIIEASQALLLNSDLQQLLARA